MIIKLLLFNLKNQYYLIHGYLGSRAFTIIGKIAIHIVPKKGYIIVRLKLIN